LTTTEPCKVPCHTLRNALRVKERADYLDSQITIVRDSIGIYQGIIRHKDSIIIYKDTQLTLLRSNEKHYENIVKLQKDTIDQARFDKVVAYILTGTSLLIAIIASL
jgi:hypothetical protein